MGHTRFQVHNSELEEEDKALTQMINDEAQRSGNRRPLDLREPSQRPLTKEQQRVKEAAKLLNLSEAEAEVFARGRE